MTSKIRLGLVFGGRSGEHEVSVRSARSVAQALDPDKYEVTLIGITKQGRWTIGDTPQRVLATTSNEMIALPDDLQASTEATLLGNPQQRELMKLESQDGGTQLASVTELDVIIPVLHGTFGEDGTIQGLFELADVPYVGGGVLNSSVCMDKAVFKAVMQGHGIPVTPYRVYTRSALERDMAGAVSEVLAAFDLPLFVKPCNLGSSVGISKASSEAELYEALSEAKRWDRRILVEPGINARELEVSVLGNDEPIASVVGEVRPRRDFYDYVAKYISDDSDLLIPAPLDEALSERIRQMAGNVFKAVDGSGLARVDFLLDRDNNAVYVNEVNTMPGFTSISMYPKLWEATGISYSELIDRLVELALERHAERNRSEHNFAQQAT